MPLQPNSTFVKVTRCNGEPSNDGTERFNKFRRQLETTPFTSGMFPVIPSTSYPPPIGRLDLFFFFQPSHFGRSFFSFFLYFRLNKQKRNRPGEPSRTNGGFSMRQFFSRKSLAWDGPVADLRSFFLLPFRIPCAGITHSWSFNLKKQKRNKKVSFLGSLTSYEQRERLLFAICHRIYSLPWRFLSNFLFLESSRYFFFLLKFDWFAKAFNVPASSSIPRDSLCSLKKTNFSQSVQRKRLRSLYRNIYQFFTLEVNLKFFSFSLPTFFWYWRLSPHFANRNCPFYIKYINSDVNKYKNSTFFDQYRVVITR